MLRAGLIQLNVSDDPAANLPVTLDLLRQAAAGGAMPVTFDQLIAPVRIGTSPTSASGTSTIMASSFWAEAVEAMPRCWMAKISSIRTAPIRKVALKCSVPRPGIGRASASQARKAGVSAVTASA